MFVPDSTYNNYVSLIIGYDLAKDNILLEGFSEWLASKYKLPTNFAFPQQIKYYLFKKDFTKTLTNEDEVLLIHCLYEKLVELQPQNEYIRKLHETLFVEGFDVFYKSMIETERSIHPLLVITYNLKKNIALAESDY